MPLLFVTVACGAISGFHGVVASGTSSKQLNNENDARLVGYFGAVGEGLLALGTIVATTSGFATLAAWEEVYSAFNEGGAAAFVQAGGGILNAGLAIPESLSATILATMAVLFAATTMDTGVRLQRFVTAEIFELFNIKLNVFMSTLVVLLTGFALAFSAGGDGRGGMIIWPLFGTTNQLLAALTMSILVVILLRTKRPVWPVLIPLIFVFFVSMYAAIIQLGTFIAEGNWLLVVIDAIILMAAVWVVLAAVSSMVRTRNQPLDLDEQMEDISAGSSV